MATACSAVTRSCTVCNGLEGLAIATGTMNSTIRIAIRTGRGRPAVCTRNNGVDFALGRPLRAVEVGGDKVRVSPRGSVMGNTGAELFTVSHCTVMGKLEFRAVRAPLLSFNNGTVCRPGLTPFAVPRAPDIIFGLFGGV